MGRKAVRCSLVESGGGRDQENPSREKPRYTASCSPPRWAGSVGGEQRLPVTIVKRPTITLSNGVASRLSVAKQHGSTTQMKSRLGALTELRHRGTVIDTLLHPTDLRARRAETIPARCRWVESVGPDPRHRFVRSPARPVKQVAGLMVEALPAQPRTAERAGGHTTARRSAGVCGLSAPPAAGW